MSNYSQCTFLWTLDVFHLLCFQRASKNFSLPFFLLALYDLWDLSSLTKEWTHILGGEKQKLLNTWTDTEFPQNFLKESK